MREAVRSSAIRGVQQRGRVLLRVERAEENAEELSAAARAALAASDESLERSCALLEMKDAELERLAEIVKELTKANVPRE